VTVCSQSSSLFTLYSGEGILSSQNTCSMLQPSAVEAKKKKVSSFGRENFFSKSAACLMEPIRSSTWTSTISACYLPLYPSSICFSLPYLLSFYCASFESFLHLFFYPYHLFIIFSLILICLPHSFLLLSLFAHLSHPTLIIPLFLSAILLPLPSLS
jgi:hypothetical protein